MNTYSNFGKWGIFLVLLLALSCSSSNPVNSPSVAGTWTILASNTDTTRMFNCHAAFNALFPLLLESLTWDDISGPGGASSSGIQMFVTQNGTAFVLAPLTVNGVTYTGGGNVTSTNSIVGRFDWVDPFTAFSLRAVFIGDVSGTSITLQIASVQDGTAPTEECTVRPSLNMDVTVS